ncbi:hypothetical protein Daura_16895 [Dactylosporangium aurantiacum]|uniref:Uncharacterized protein n=1 Tax=Dactylosporangium aurantiacum TaxID=35754 RepID=A0A9Q9IRI2_9ACTN|nr:hypothetical protein [Dactylosporangium aurantiacum]MDG6103183.1 hypothetical protein [Dactylosporangium aurantiacum]UWZ57688.1 hypothetical protein Daura_16895 [Dactylosporangium aurantiacum]
MTLLLKLVLAPLLVVGSSLAGRRWGAAVAGTLVALPIVAGPILFITCLEQGLRFGARAASASLLGLVSLATFTVVFAWCSRRTGWLASLSVAWLATLALDLGLARLDLPPLVGFTLVLTSAWLALRAFPHVPTQTTTTTSGWPWWDLPGRALATAGLVVAVTTAAATLGPSMTGVLAPFPIATSVVAAFVLAQQGTDATVHTLRGVPRGLLGFAVFCLLVAILVERLGTAGAFAVAVAGTLTIQLIWRRVLASTA